MTLSRMGRWGVVALVALLSVSEAAGQRTATTFRGPAIGAPTFVSGVVYDGGSLKVDIWKPAVANRPAVILLHGGGWDTGSRTDEVYARLAAYLAERGFAVFNADYTLTGGSPLTPEGDVRTLVAWVRTNAATYNADSTRVTLLGLSAGAHLAVMAGIQGTTGTSRPDAVVAWSLPADLEEAYSQGNGPETLGVGGFLNVELTGNEALYRTHSPIDQLTSDHPPLRLVHSTAERTDAGEPGLAEVQYTSFLAAAQAAGIDVTGRLITGNVHALFFTGVGSLNTTVDYNGWLADDLEQTCAWIIGTLGDGGADSARTAATARTAASGRAAPN